MKKNMAKAGAKRARSGPSRETAQQIQQWLALRQKDMVTTIRHLVEMESPSHNKAAVDKLGQYLAREFQRLGGKVTFHRQRKYGDHLQVDWAAGKRAGAESGAKPVLLLGHIDTVWDVGTLRIMPFQINKGRLWGPGAYDMKTGLAEILYAVRVLRQVNQGLPRPVTVLLVSDEEVGSDSSRAITETVAKKSAAVLVAEPSSGLHGALKTWRKGVGDYTVKAVGLAAHSGIDFERGESAVLELARQIAEIEKFTDLKRGITVNVGVVRGGTRTNVIAAEAEAHVDVRIMKLEDAAYIDKRFRALKPKNKRCRLEVTGGINRPPMERSEGVAKLFALARQAGEALRMEVRESGTGGGSDGNFTAALGIPTLDGLGGVGEGAHAAHESVLLEEIPRRTALLAMLIESI